MPWGDLLTDEPTTPRQRRACYRLGLSRHFVHQHVRTKEQARALIADMLAVQERLRAENESENRITADTCRNHLIDP